MEYCGGGSLQDIYHGELGMTLESLDQELDPVLALLDPTEHLIVMEKNAPVKL